MTASSIEARGARLTHLTLVRLWAILLLLVSATWVVGPLRAYGSPATLMGLGLAVLWAIAGQLPSVRLEPRASLRLAIAMFGLWSLYTFVLSLNGPTTPFALNEGARACAFFVAAAGPCLVIAEGLADEQELRKLVKTVVACGGIAALVGVIQFRTGFDPAPYLAPPGLVPNGSSIDDLGARSFFTRPRGTAQHAIEFGVVLGMLFPLSLWQARQQSWRTREGKLWWAVLGITAFGALASISRSAVVALGAAAAVTFLCATPLDRRRLAVLGIGLIAMTRLAADGLLGTLRSFFLAGQQDNSIEGRTRDFAGAIDLIMDRPFTGVGWGRFNPTEFFLLDNQVLDTILESGIPGLVLLLTIPTVAVLRVLPRRAELDLRFDGLAGAVLASIAAGTLPFATFDAFSFRMFTGLYFATIGLAFAVERIGREGIQLPAVAATSSTIANELARVARS